MSQHAENTACFHSMVVEDCVSCLQGQIQRMSAYIMRLRTLADPKSLAIHDAYWLGGNTPRNDGDVYE